MNSEAHLIWKKNNPDKVLGYVRKWRKKNKQKVAEYNRQWSARHPNRRKTINLKCMLKVKYGLTLDQYSAMLKSQGGLCAICGNPPKRKRLGIDHDHITGMVRGLLCGICNSGIAHLGHDPNIMQRAILYLQEHGKI